MARNPFFSKQTGTLRQRIMTSVGAMVLLSLLGSSVSLYRITEVNRLLEAINHISVPLGRLLIQMQSDAEVFRREFERSMGYVHWKDQHWQARPVPKWIEEVLENEVVRVTELIQKDSDWAHPEARAHWREWVVQISVELKRLIHDADQLHLTLIEKNEALAGDLYPKWMAAVDEWRRQLRWGAAEFDHSLRRNFSTTENRVVELRLGLEMIFIIVVLMSLLFLWLGERALRPLDELTRLAREITRRGLRKEDKSLLPDFSLSRSDEVSQLSREFHHMATALLEREKTVEAQKNRLQEQNRLLREILNEEVKLQERLRRAENLAAVGRMSAQVAHEVRNPLHSIGLEAELAIETASQLGHVSLKQSLQSILNSVDRLQKITENYLKLNRLSTGEKGLIDLSDVLQSVLATYAPVCESQDVKVDWHREAKANLNVCADRDLLEQVLGNLFKNSLQALETLPLAAPREIKWSLGNTENSKAYIKIEDNGPGISLDVKERLFTPFVTTRAQGTGLGLSFVKKVLEDHGGSIHNVSRPPLCPPSTELPESVEANFGGRGACFELTLPLLEPEVSHVVEDFISR